MIFDKIAGKIPARIGQGSPSRLPNYRRLMFLLPLLLMLSLAVSISLAACSDVSPAFGQYYKGRVLHLNVVKLERTPELLYQHGDKHYRIRPSEANLELVLIRVKVENHTATSVIVNVDSQAADIRDFVRGKYFPINPNERFEEVDAPANPADERSLVFLWNPTLADGTARPLSWKRVMELMAG